VVELAGEFQKNRSKREIAKRNGISRTSFAAFLSPLITRADLNIKTCVRISRESFSGVILRSFGSICGSKRSSGLK